MSSFDPDAAVVAQVAPSPNYDERRRGARPAILLLHYTGMVSTYEALKRLRDPQAKVSSHYLVCENGTVIQLVPETQRAWHAGESSWAGETDINSLSIGVEIGNPGHDFSYPDFSEEQIAAVIALAQDILARHAIRADRVLAHSDVAPHRKNDPGEKFPWSRLQMAGVGLWVSPVPIRPGPALALGDHGAQVADVQRALAEYGYGIPVTGGYDAATKEVVIAFQRHFRPARIDGIADVSTVRTLKALLAEQNALCSRAARGPG